MNPFLPADSIDVPFGPRLTQRVRFCDDAFGDSSQVFPELVADAPRVLACIDSNVAAAQPELPDRVTRCFNDRCGIAAPVYTVLGGEAVKNEPRHLEEIVGAIHDAKLCRRSYVVAVGGGAVLDAVGYAAAIAHRGIRLIRVPTTTLSQADSCVAVKCGINAFGKKNYLGVFTAPWAIVIDPTLLSTLSERDWRCGFSEAVKVGLVKERALFEQIRRDAPRIAARDLTAAWTVIRRSAEIHLRHITDGGDPFELTEARPLDFGHWAAHRLESMTNYELRHGEAVAIGIAIDATYSELQGWLSATDAVAVRDTLSALGFSLAHPSLRDTAALLSGLEEFREHLGGRLTIAMLRGIGRGFDVHEIDDTLMLESIRRLTSTPARPATPLATEAA